MPVVAIIVILDSLVVMTTGVVLNRRAKKEGGRVANSMDEAIRKNGPEIMAQALSDPRVVAAIMNQIGQK